jgi:hypothetical protein
MTSQLTMNRRAHARRSSGLRASRKATKWRSKATEYVRLRLRMLRGGAL